MRYQHLLFERNSDILDALRKYHEPDIFISFRSLPKLGINPQSQWDTPIGIYGYPLIGIWTELMLDKVPFAGKEDYVIVFKAVRNASYHVPDVLDYSEAMWEHDRENIMRSFLERYRAVYSTLNADHTWGNQSRYMDRALEVMNADPGHSKAFKNRAWAELVISGRMKLDDPSLVEDIIKGGYFTAHTIAQLKALAKEFNDGVLLDENKARQSMEQNVAQWESEAKLDLPAAKFWNVTRELGFFFASSRPRQRVTGAVVWTSLMRALGYEGFTDTRGIGLIHENEPIQGVFFSTKPLRLLEILPNVRKPKRTQ